MELFQFADLQIAQKHSIYVGKVTRKPMTQNINLLLIISLFEMFRPSSDTAFSFLKNQLVVSEHVSSTQKKPHLHPIKKKHLLQTYR